MVKVTYVITTLFLAMTSSSPMQIPNSNSPFGSPPLTSFGESLFQQNKLTIDLSLAVPQLKGLMGLPGTLGSGVFHCFV